MNANPETQHKVLILGNQEVGKTAIVNSVSLIKTMGIKYRGNLVTTRHSCLVETSNTAPRFPQVIFVTLRRFYPI